MPDGAITHEAYKAMVLQLDDGSDDAEQQIRMELERKFGRELGRAFDDQLQQLIPDNATEEQVRAAVHQVTATSDGVRAVLRQSLEQSSSLGVSVALDTLEQIGMGFDWTLAHSKAAKWASTYTYELIQGINTTTQARLQTAVDDWFREPTTIRDLQRELEPTFGKRRAKLIAQTETTRAAHEGSAAGYEESGVVAEMEWVAVNDEKVCPICGNDPNGLNGKRAPLRGTFPGGYKPPAHPGCRCFVRPVVEGKKPKQEQKPAAPEPIKPQPVGPPVSGALTVSKGKAKEEIDTAMRAIDSVHGDGTLRPIPVTQRKSTTTYGVYKFRGGPGGRSVPVEINISPVEGNHAAITMAHEVGHYLDNQALRITQELPSDKITPEIQAWRDAIKESESVKTLQDWYRNGHEITIRDSTRPEMSVTQQMDRKFIKNYLRHDELWARSYEQYIATRSGDPTMVAQISAIRATDYGAIQWGDEDFAPIANAIDGILKAAGWLK
jgi:SPP1 gp7 family putative phage head morphogenesis protein